MTSGMCRALYSVHSFKAVLDSLSGQQNFQLSAFPHGVVVGSRCCCIYTDPGLMGSSGAISPECQYPNRGFFGILSFYLEWMDQLLRIFHRSLWGQILSFALCATCIKSQDQITWIWDESALKNIWSNHELLMWLYITLSARIVLDVHYIINYLPFWLFQVKFTNPF